MVRKEAGKIFIIISQSEIGHLSKYGLMKEERKKLDYGILFPHHADSRPIEVNSYFVCFKLLMILALQS